MMSFDDGNPCTVARTARGQGACRAVGNARQGPSPVRWVAFAIVAAHVSRADNVLRNGKTVSVLRGTRIVLSVSKTENYRIWFLDTCRAA